MNVRLNVPDHTTLSRRNSTLKPKLKRVGKPRGRVDLVIDSTDLVIHLDVYIVDVAESYVYLLDYIIYHSIDLYTNVITGESD